MLTIFSTCRSFNDNRFNIIQRNAIGSWMKLNPRPQIMIMGDDPGSKEICKEFNLEYYDVECSSFGTPLVNSMIKLAEKHGKFDTKLCISSDIILFQNTIKSIKPLKEMKEFCGVAIKLENNNINDLIDFESDWTKFALNNVKQGMVTSGDYFLYSSKFWENSKMPEFVVGRTHTDSWMFCEAVRRKCLVNLTPCVQIVHQQHHYNHIPKGDPERSNNERLKKGFGADIRYSNFVMNGHFKLQKNDKRIKTKYD